MWVTLAYIIPFYYLGFIQGAKACFVFQATGSGASPYLPFP